jgi:hypothetical protein
MKLTLLIGTLVGIGCFFLQAQETKQSESSVSPDKQWEYQCQPYGNYAQCAPVIVKAGTRDEVLDLGEELLVNGPEEKNTEVIWAPDSKRFACNYSPTHAHHTSFVVVAFYELRGDKWVMLQPPADLASSRLQLAQLGKGHLPKEFNVSRCPTNRDILKVRSWPDANTVIVYAPCYGGKDGGIATAFLFTLRFDAAGKWKVVHTHRMSKKELEDEQQ